MIRDYFAAGVVLSRLLGVHELLEILLHRMAVRENSCYSESWNHREKME